MWTGQEDICVKQEPETSSNPGSPYHSSSLVNPPGRQHLLLPGPSRLTTTANPGVHTITFLSNHSSNLPEEATGVPLHLHVGADLVPPARHDPLPGQQPAPPTLRPEPR